MGVSRGGVRHPSMHVSDGAPRVGGASPGPAGSVGEEVTLAPGEKASRAAGGADDATEPKPPSSSEVSPPRSHAAASSMNTATATMNLRIVPCLSGGTFYLLVQGKRGRKAVW